MAYMLPQPAAESSRRQQLFLKKAINDRILAPVLKPKSSFTHGHALQPNKLTGTTQSHQSVESDFNGISQAILPPADANSMPGRPQARSALKGQHKGPALTDGRSPYANMVEAQNQK